MEKRNMPQPMPRIEDFKAENGRDELRELFALAVLRALSAGESYRVMRMFRNDR